MAGKLTLFITMAVLSAIVAGATKFHVGDDAGWNLKVNYTHWAEGKTFDVGDSLFFLYDAQKHNVLRVNGADFKDCNTSANTEPLTSGKDTLALTKPGKKWYISGKGKDCKSGMKLFINVNTEAEAPSPSPSPSLPPSPAGDQGNSGNVVAYPYLLAVVVASLAVTVVL